MIHTYLARNFSLDLNLLGLFRIGVGLLLLVDLGLRCWFELDLISPAGVLPVEPALAVLQNKSPLSLFLVSAQGWFFYGLLILTFLAYLGYLVGYKTKLLGILSFVFLFSLQNRNPYILHGGDVLLRMFLLISLFLPLQAYSLANGFNREEGKISSFATVALLIQIGLMYLFSAAYKTGAEWFDGSALFYALRLTAISSPFGQWLTQFPAILRNLTYATVALEFLIFPLILLNFGKPWLRGILCVGLCIFHFGICVAMDIGTFPFVCLLGAFLFFPGLAVSDFSASSQSSRADFQLHLKNILVLAILTLVFICNIYFFFSSTNDGVMKSLLVNTGVYQRWSMFSPSPAKENITFQFLSGGDTPTDLNLKKAFEGHHWHKFLMQASRINNHEIVDLLGRYVCDKTGVQELKILIYVRSLQAANFQAHIPTSRAFSLFDAKCGAGHEN